MVKIIRVEWKGDCPHYLDGDNSCDISGKKCHGLVSENCSLRGEEKGKDKKITQLRQRIKGLERLATVLSSRCYIEGRHEHFGIPCPQGALNRKIARMKYLMKKGD